MSELSDALPDALSDPAACYDEPRLNMMGGAICVVAPLDLIETSFVVPAVRALKSARPERMLVVLCIDEQLPMWQLMSQVDLVISYGSKATSRQIAKLLVDVETVFESSIVWEACEAAKALAHAGVLQRFGYSFKGVAKYLTDPMELLVTPAPIEHRVRHYLNLVEKLGVEAYTRESFAAEALRPAPKRIRIAIAPASDMGESYEWPLERYAEVVRLVNEHYDDVVWTIVGDINSKQSQAKCMELRAMLGGVVKDLSLECGLRALLSELPHYSALLACDNHTAHIAAHVGLPAVVVFGPNEPDWKRPIGKQSRVVREHVACSPCYLPKCKIDLRCQEQVAAEKVANELVKALQDRCSS